MKEQFWLKQLKLHNAFWQWGSRFGYIPWIERLNHTEKEYVLAEMTLGGWIKVEINKYHTVQGVSRHLDIQSRNFESIEEAITWLENDVTGIPTSEWRDKDIPINQSEETN